MMLKYKISIDCTLGVGVICPKDPKTYNDVAYCFMHEDKDNPDNFKPHGCRFPARVLVAKHLETKCAFFGLSFFADAEKAKILYKHFNGGKNPGHFSKTNGTLLAKIRILEEDGVYDKIDEKTHFNFFEFIGINFLDKIVDTEIL